AVHACRKPRQRKRERLYIAIRHDFWGARCSCVLSH
ncbi:putative zinc-regulated TonB-dependent outer membrane receptor, partial [Vibrio parahaemolyticus VPTS-2010_2]